MVNPSGPKWTHSHALVHAHHMRPRIRTHAVLHQPIPTFIDERTLLCSALCCTMLHHNPTCGTMLHHVTVESSVHLASLRLELLGLRLLLQLGDFIKPLLYVRPARNASGGTTLPLPESLSSAILSPLAPTACMRGSSPVRQSREPCALSAVCRAHSVRHH
jgi:hypothetical protein